MSQQWQERKRPVRLEGRYEFKHYSALRDFLDKAAELSEKNTGRRPIPQADHPLRRGHLWGGSIPFPPERARG